MKRLTIAIDGPAGAGKSTVAKAVAKRLDYIYVDTGAMYRSVAWQTLKQKVAAADAAAVTKVAENMTIRLENEAGSLKVYANETNITTQIRSPEVTALVASVAQIPGVRAALVRQQQALAKNGGVVMDGRDIGTKVLPKAEVKVFLTASVETRAERRLLEMKAKGYEVDKAQLTAEIAARDRADSERACSPLIQAEDAVYLDTSSLTIEEAVAFIFMLCVQKGVND